MFKASKTNKTRKSAKITTNTQDEVSPQVPTPSTVDKAPAATTEDKVPAPSTVDVAPAPSTVDVAPTATSEDKVPTATSEDKVPAATSEDKVPTATSEDGAPPVTTEDKAPVPTTEDGAPPATTEDGAPPATTEDKAEGDEAPAKSTYNINALDLSEQRRIEEERKMLEAAKHPRSFLPSISSVTNALKKLPIPSLPPIPVVVMAKAAKLVPTLMTIVDKISDPDIINRISTYIEKSQELAIAKKEKELEKLKGGGIPFFTEEECSFF
jgi:hypothetical protein